MLMWDKIVALAMVVVGQAGPGSGQSATGAGRLAGLVAEPVQRAPIVGGELMPECAWPTAVALMLGRRLCSGTLVHPDIVVYAAHCGIDVDAVYFGENINTARAVAVDACFSYPGSNIFNGTDFAYCRLAESVNDVPIVPILMGCEAAVLTQGRAVTLVGFGRDDEAALGAKHATVARMLAPEGLKAILGGDGLDSCYGDSGGPAFVKLDDGAWRVFGLTSYGRSQACGPGGFYALLQHGVPWIEAHSGVDITPCFAADGAWRPNADCGQFPLQPQRGMGRWQHGCASGAALSAWGQSCGPPHAAALPQLHLLAAAGAVGAAHLRASDAQGGPLRRLVAELNGQPLGLLDDAGAPDYHFALPPLPVGGHRLTVTGEDASGRRHVRTWSLMSRAPVAASGGCQASPSGGFGAAAAAWLMLGRWRRGRLLVLLAGSSCGPQNAPPPAATGKVVSRPPPPDLGRHKLPAGAPSTADIIGANGEPMAWAEAIFILGRPAPDGTPPPLVLLLSDHPDACALLMRGAAWARAEALSLTLTNRLPPPSDQPSSGHYSLGSAADAGHRLHVERWHLGDGCESLLTQEEGLAVAGSVDIDTHITATGARVVGDLLDLRFADGSGAHQGSFSASICDLGGRAINPPQVCLQAPRPTKQVAPAR